MAACLPAFSALFFCLFCLWAGVDGIRTRYSHGTETTSLFSWLTCSTSSGLSHGWSRDSARIGSHSPLNKPCILSRGVCVVCVCIWRLNGGVIEQEACLESGNSQSWTLTTDFYSLFASLLRVPPAAAPLKTYPSHKILVELIFILKSCSVCPARGR